MTTHDTTARDQAGHYVANLTRTELAVFLAETRPPEDDPWVRLTQMHRTLDLDDLAAYFDADERGDKDALNRHAARLLKRMNDRIVMFRILHLDLESDTPCTPHPLNSPETSTAPSPPPNDAPQPTTAAPTPS